MEKRKEKKGKKIRKRILYLLAGAVVVLTAGFFLSHRIGGKASVILNGEKYLLTDLECSYLDHDGEIVKTRHMGRAPMYFMSGGFQYGMYEYSFSISNEEINIRPRIRVFKTNIRARYNLDIKVELIKVQDIWNGEITVKVNGRTYTESFEDLKRGEMVIRVE